MPEIDQNVELWRGNSLIIKIPVVDENDAHVDLSTITAKWCIARDATSKAEGDVFLAKDNASVGGISIHFNVAADELWITLVQDDTKDLAPGIFYHEAEIVDAADNIYTVTVGKFTLKGAKLPPRSP